MAILPNPNPIPQNPETGGLQRQWFTKEEFDDQFFDIQPDSPIDPELHEFYQKAQLNEVLEMKGFFPPSAQPEITYEERNAVINSLTFLKNVPSYLLEITAFATKALASLFNRAAKDLGINLNYHPNSTTRLKGTTTPGVITIGRMKQALIVQGMNILVKRVAVMELEKLNAIQQELTAAIISFGGKRFISLPANKVVFGNLVAAAQKFLTGIEMAKAELAIRNGSFEGIQAMIRSRLTQNRKFAGGKTRVNSEVYGRV
jgi:hypothetical protein